MARSFPNVAQRQLYLIFGLWGTIMRSVWVYRSVHGFMLFGAFAWEVALDIR